MKNRIKEIRKQHKITQEKLAMMLNTTQTNISGWERNAWEPSSESASKMCDIFHCSLDYLLGRSEENQNIEQEVGTVTMWSYGTGKVTVKLSKEELAVIEALIRAKNK